MLFYMFLHKSIQLSFFRLFLLRSVSSFQVLEGHACYNLCFYELSASKKDAIFERVLK